MGGGDRRGRRRAWWSLWVGRVVLEALEWGVGAAGCRPLGGRARQGKTRKTGSRAGVWRERRAGAGLGFAYLGAPRERGVRREGKCGGGVYVAERQRGQGFRIGVSESSPSVYPWACLVPGSEWSSKEVMKVCVWSQWGG